MFDDFKQFLMCPHSKEKLSIITKDELNQFLQGRIELPAGDVFLINESKSFIYSFSKTGFPVLLPESAIPTEITLDEISLAFNPNNTVSYDTLLKHKRNLEILYKKQNFQSKPFHMSTGEYDYIRTAVMKPAIENLTPGNVLDVGGGFGYFRNFTKGRLHVIVDVSEEMLNSSSSLDKINGRSESIPILKNSFDNVVSFGSLEHVLDVQTSMVELARCLLPGGRFIVSCWRDDWPACQKHTIWAITNFFYFLEKSFLLAKNDPALLIDRFLYKTKIKKSKKTRTAQFWDPDSQKIHSRRFDREVFGQMLEKAGFKILQKGYCGKEFPGRVRLPRYIVDKYFNSMKYGSYFFFVCTKDHS